MHPDNKEEAKSLYEFFILTKAELNAELKTLCKLKSTGSESNLTLTLL